ncbi:MAG: nucleotidyltransferase domain-containing protein [Candidatus Bathyarchaeia archaeon]
MPDESLDLSEVFKGRVEAAFLFGGRAKGYSVKGDYDVAVYFGRPFDLYELGGLLIDIAEALNVSEDRIDLISLDSATPKMVMEALKGKIIFMKDEYALFKLRLKASLESLDVNAASEKWDCLAHNDVQPDSGRGTTWIFNCTEER